LALQTLVSNSHFSEGAVTIQHLVELSTLANGEHEYRNCIVARKGYGSAIHNPQIAGKHFIIGQSLKTLRITVGLRISRIDAIDTCPFEERVTFQLCSTQRRSGVSCKERIARPCRTQHYLALVEV